MFNLFLMMFDVAEEGPTSPTWFAKIPEPQLKQTNIHSKVYEIHRKELKKESWRIVEK